MKHHKFNEISKLVDNNMAVLLMGEKGSGKTTLARQVAEEQNRDFMVIGMTRQTTLGHLLGFINVNGVYIPSHLRHTFEHGGLFLIDEIDAGDPNVLLSINTIENGYITFPDKMVEVHPEFRLMAAANPKNQHAEYTGRAKLDAATEDRFDRIPLDRDENLEQSLVDSDTFRKMEVLRKIMKDHNATQTISMRDSIRYQKRKELSLLDDFVFNLVDGNELILDKYNDAIANMPNQVSQSDCTNIDDLIEVAMMQSGKST